MPTQSAQSLDDKQSDFEKPPAQHSQLWIWITLGCVLFGIIAVGLTRSSRNQISTADDLTTVETFPDITAGHREGPLIYQQIPPAGGIHNPIWQNCGIYDTPVANGNAVHSLEHGAVWITYRLDLPTEQIKQLQQLVRGKTHALLSPYPGLPSPVVASAWGVQLKVGSAVDPRLLHFMTKYMQGPQAPEPNEPCTGGIGDPIP